VTIEAEELYQAYRDDPDAATREFGGREMVVSGERSVLFRAGALNTVVADAR
jgi:uncharacterized protein (DUF1330 family)